jgi:hypothetical protein
MKIQQKLWITNVDEFMKGNHNWCFNLTAPNVTEIDGWIEAGFLWVEPEITIDELVEKASAELDRAAEKVKADAAAQLALIAQKKQELLAIEYKEAV